LVGVVVVIEGRDMMLTSAEITSFDSHSILLYVYYGGLRMMVVVVEVLLLMGDETSTDILLTRQPSAQITSAIPNSFTTLQRNGFGSGHGRIISRTVSREGRGMSASNLIPMV
jgi:hypothetical protein